MTCSRSQSEVGTRLGRELRSPDSQPSNVRTLSYLPLPGALLSPEAVDGDELGWGSCCPWEGAEGVKRGRAAECRGGNEGMKGVRGSVGVIGAQGKCLVYAWCATQQCPSAETLPYQIPQVGHWEVDA